MPKKRYLVPAINHPYLAYYYVLNKRKAYLFNNQRQLLKSSLTPKEILLSYKQWTGNWVEISEEEAALLI